MDRGHSPKRRKLDTEEYSIAPRPKFRKPNHPASRSQTPRAHENGSNPHQKSFDGPEPLVEELDSMALDRDWYGGEENGHTFGDDTHNPFGGNDSTWLDAQREAALTEKKQNNRASMRAQQKQKDVDAWETNRMLQSGVAQRRHFDDDFNDDEEATRIHILVHDLKPPFLDGKTVFTKQIEPVPAVRDPQSDMAVAS
jgi:pre-mRNA-splicing factor ATP-dependent RNA helicase DHX38/PRP16